MGRDLRTVWDTEVTEFGYDYDNDDIDFDTLIEELPEDRRCYRRVIGLTIILNDNGSV